MRIPWTRYQFSVPTAMAEDQFIAMHVYPRQFRRERWRGLRYAAAINLARLIGAVATGWLGYNRFQDPTFAVEFSWLTYGLILGGFALFVSCGLSLLSFLWFLVRFALYWERVIAVASRYEEVSQFRHELVARGLLAERAEHRLRRPISAG